MCSSDLELGETVFLGRPEAEGVRIVERVEVEGERQALRISAPRGVRVPLLAAATGRVVLASHYSIADRSLAGACFETDFASFLAWRDWNFPDAEAVNVFAMGALRSRDGAFLLGVMGPHTANAGRIYFPAGTPEPDDVADGTLDLAGNVVREVAEETGLAADDYVATPGWHAIPAGRRLALMKVLEADAPARDLQERMRAHIADDKHPELADIRIVRGPADFDPMMPRFVTAFLSQVLG